MITYYVEQAHHFRCGRCAKLWCIASLKVKENTVLTCPHCGCVDEVTEDRRNHADKET